MWEFLADNFAIVLAVLFILIFVVLIAYSLWYGAQLEQENRQLDHDHEQHAEPIERTDDIAQVLDALPVEPSLESWSGDPMVAYYKHFGHDLDKEKRDFANAYLAAFNRIEDTPRCAIVLTRLDPSTVPAGQLLLDVQEVIVPSKMMLPPVQLEIVDQRPMPLEHINRISSAEVPEVVAALTASPVSTIRGTHLGGRKVPEKWQGPSFPYTKKTPEEIKEQLSQQAAAARQAVLADVASTVDFACRAHVVNPRMAEFKKEAADRQVDVKVVIDEFVAAVVAAKIAETEEKFVYPWTLEARLLIPAVERWIDLPKSRPIIPPG
jgi:hypothetical protein